MGSMFQVFGNNVRNRRKELSFSQEELAYKIDRDVRTIRYIESGNSNSTIKTIKKLSKTLKTTASKLLGF